MTTGLWIAAGLVALYGVFLLWYGGSGRPLDAAETERFMALLGAQAEGPEGQRLLAQVRDLVSQDDGREFVMHNVVRHRPQARYPEGLAQARGWSEDAREADRRYGRLLAPHLLRNGCLPLFIAPRVGRFIEPDGLPCWDYVAMVRYRSMRDFLRFALAIETGEIALHKWAAIEITQVFPVRPLFSLIVVRLLVAGMLALLGWGLWGIMSLWPA